MWEFCAFLESSNLHLHLFKEKKSGTITIFFRYFSLFWASLFYRPVVIKKIVAQNLCITYLLIIIKRYFDGKTKILFYFYWFWFWLSFEFIQNIVCLCKWLKKGEQIIDNDEKQVSCDSFNTLLKWLWCD